MDSQTALTKVEQAAAEGKITAGAAENIRVWLTEPRYAEYAAQVAEHVEQGKWQQLDDVFWTIIPFGTGGRRGKMYPIGSNAINDRTIGESAQGLAEYVREQGEATGELACAIAYDTRHRSREFAELCAEIMVANGFKVYFLDGYRSTPACSFLVRYKNCSCGIMVTASHNPPSDNAVKAYWSTGGQLLPPHDKGVIDRVMNVSEIQRVPFQQAVSEGKVVFCQEEIDRAFIEAVVKQAIPGPRELKILFSPLHGVGTSAVIPALEADGFQDMEVYGPQADPNGDFPNVPGHVSNPENPEVFDALIVRAKEIGADLALATDPDCDRLGLAAPLTSAADSEWQTMTGNQIGVLLAEYVLNGWQKAGRLTPDHYVVTTLVTTQMFARIAEAYGVKCYDNLLVGFKWIGGLIDEVGPERFVYAMEESHGYLAGTHVRDKDAAVGAMLVAELAAQVKAEGQTLHEKLDALYWQYGCHAEKMVAVTLPGAEGMDRMKQLMAQFRSDPPQQLAGLRVTRVRDYLNQTVTEQGGTPQPLDGPKGDLVCLDLEKPGTFVAVRPSGTEPKVKFYNFTSEPPEQLHDLEETKKELAQRLDDLARDLRAFAGA